MKTKVLLIVYLLYCGLFVSSAQEAEPFFTESSETNTEILRETLREARSVARDRALNRPAVKPAVLSSEDIDSLILQKLHYSLQSDPNAFQDITGFSDADVDRLAANLSDFTNVVLEQQRLALDDMCAAWDPSSVEVEAMIDESLAAFDASSKSRTPASYQAIRNLLIDIETNVAADQMNKFNEMLAISRKEFAGRKVFTFAQNARIMGDTEATLRYHCEEVR